MTALPGGHAPETLAERLAAVFEEDILPATRAGVAAGNKVFGAALLRKDTLETVLVGTNNETANPLWHGEVHTLKLFHELPAAARPAPSELIFLSSHEPCTMCLSAITWAGFDNFTYLFSHEDSRDAFSIPHDLKILEEVFGLPPGGYRRENAYWTATSLPALVADLPDSEPLASRLRGIRAAYAALSDAYQAGKDGNAIPLP